MLVSFNDRSALVTGAGHGIGRGLALGLAERGARVVGVDINGAALAETAAALAAAGAGSTTAVVDIRSRAAVQELVTAHGPFDILMNSAGGVLGQVGQPLEAVTEDQWEAIVAVNLTGAFHCAQAVVPAMKARGEGRIVVISSGAGITVSLTGIQAYASAKAGVLGLTRQLAHELGPFGITVNSVAPGFVRSNPTTERQWDSYGPEGQRKLLESIALRRLGTVDDIVHAALFLASPFAGWITGQVLSVNGGR